MRILLVCDDSPSAFVGGTVISAMYLAKGLGAMGHDTVLAWPEDPERFPMEGVRQVRIPARKLHLGTNHVTIAVPFRRRDLPPGFHPEIVHAMQPTPLSVALRWQTERWGVPFLVSMHVLLEQIYDPFLRGILENWNPWLYRLVDRTVTPCDFATDYANRRYRLPRRARTLSNGIDLGLIRSRVEGIGKEPLGGRTVRVCSAISLLPYKNPGLMLEVFARLQAQGVDATLDLAGGGPLLPELEAQRERLGLTERVRFLGPLPQPELLALFARSDAFLLTSPVEVQPMVLLESKAVGLPALVSDAPLNGGRDLVEDGVTGRLFPADDPDAATAVIASALSDPASLERMAKAAYADAERYDFMAVARDATALYERMIAVRQRARRR